MGTKSISDKVYLDPDDPSVIYYSLKDIEEEMESFDDGDHLDVIEYNFVRKVRLEKISTLKEVPIPKGK